MAKASGLGVTTFSLDDSAGALQALVNDVTNFNFDTPRALQDITGLDKSAMEKLHLLADFTLSFNGIFNTATNAIFDVVKTLANTRSHSLVHASKTLNNEVLLSSVAWTRAASGEFTVAVSASLQNGTVPAWS